MLYAVCSDNNYIRESYWGSLSAILGMVQGKILTVVKSLWHPQESLSFLDGFVRMEELEITCNSVL
jgi:hypothetical protein